MARDEGAGVTTYIQTLDSVRTSAPRLAHFTSRPGSRLRPQRQETHGFL